MFYGLFISLSLGGCNGYRNFKVINGDVMKAKELQGALVDESIGDAHSQLAWEGFVEAELMSNMAHYARDQNYPNGYEFGKAMEAMAYEVWKLVNEKYSDEVPF